VKWHRIAIVSANLRREVDELRCDVNQSERVGDEYADVNEQRIVALEELLYTRWPRRIAVRRRLARDLRASVAHAPGETFAERRTEAISTGWGKPLSGPGQPEHLQPGSVTS
jgi:hypothetical protein